MVTVLGLFVLCKIKSADHSDSVIIMLASFYLNLIIRSRSLSLGGGLAKKTPDLEGKTLGALMNNRDRAKHHSYPKISSSNFRIVVTFLLLAAKP